MLMTDLISRKKQGGTLSGEEIAWWIREYVAGSIPDYQVSALLMAICLKGMSTEETVSLTMAMTYSGDVVDLSAIPGIKVDKHSTGGVADTTTLIVAPLAAACGVKVAKMSGRGLGHTGGTIDKLESIPGFDAALSPERFLRNVAEVGLAVTGQSASMVPADKLLYALRDVTSTVDSLPLIASSIMSKKIASGADAIVLDVKSGSGAFLSSEAEAFALAEQMVAIGKGAGRNTVALITDMDQPLGRSVGNALEVYEAIEVLQGKVRGPLRDLSLRLAAEMLLLSEGAPGETTEAARPDSTTQLDRALATVGEALASGRALATLRRMVEAQGGDPRVIDDPALLPRASEQVPVPSARSGFVTSFDTQAIGRAAMHLGAGRAKAGDQIDHAAGLILTKRLGDAVAEGEPLAILHLGRHSDRETAATLVTQAIHIGNIPPSPHLLLLGRLPAR